MFRIVDGKGFHITFENGVIVSVQFGWGSYRKGYPDLTNAPGDFEKTSKILYARESGGGYISEVNAQLGMEGSPDAEIAIFDKDGNWLTEEFKKGDSVIGYQTAEDVLKALNWAARYKKK